MRRIILGLVATLVVGAPIALAAAPANADTSSIPYPVGGRISLDVGDVSYGADGDCRYAPVTVDIDVPDDYSYAEFEYTSTYDGPTTLSDTIYGNEDWSGTYSHNFMVCPEYDNPGSYVGYLDVTFYDYDDYYGEYSEVASAHTSDAFRVTGYNPPVVHHSSTLTTNKIKTGTHGWTIRTTSTYDGRAWAGRQVKFQQKYSGSWHTVRSVWTGTTGRANYAFTPAAGPAKPYRAVLTAGPGVTQKVSPTYWLARR